MRASVDSERVGVLTLVSSLPEHVLVPFALGRGAPEELWAVAAEIYGMNFLPCTEGGSAHRTLR